MPRFNAAGDLCIGLGRDWFDHRTIAQECNTIRPGCVIALSDGTIVAERGANYVCAGGGVWAAWLGGYGLYDSLGSYFPDSGLGPAGPGCYARKVQYFSYGPWMVHEQDGSEWLLTNGDAYDIQLLVDGKALWREAGILHTRGFELADPIPAGEYWWPRAVLVNGQYCLLYQSPQGLIFHERIVATGKAFYRPDAIQIGDSVHFCWALQEQEYGVTPAPLVMPIAALLALPVLQNVGSSPQVPTLPQPLPEPIPVPVSPVPNLLADLKALRAEYPAEVTPGQAVESLNRFAASHEGFGLHKKTGGNHAPQPGSGTPCSVDWLLYKHASGIWGTDVYGKGPDATVPPSNPLYTNVASPGWSKWHLVSDPQNFVAPAAVTDPVTTVPDPVTPAPSVDLAALRNEVAALSARLALLEGRVEGAMDAAQARISNVETTLYALGKRGYRVVIDDSKDAPRLSTSKEFGHAHRIALKVEPA